MERIVSILKLEPSVGFLGIEPSEFRGLFLFDGTDGIRAPRSYLWDWIVEEETIIKLKVKE